jgi:hypothetical protein
MVDEKDPKVALCLFGQMRTYRKCLPHLKREIIDPLEPDIFIHTWRDRGGTWKEVSDNEGQRGTISEELIRRQYSATAVEVEKFEQHNYYSLSGIEVPKEVVGSDDFCKTMLPMFYKMHAVNRLRTEEGAEDYDSVILTRPDLAFGSRLPRNILSQPEVLYQNPTGPRTMDDQFTVGSPRDISKMVEVFDKLPDYWHLKQGEKPDFSTNEHVLFHHCYEQDLQVEEIDTLFQIMRQEDSKPYWEMNLPKRLYYLASQPKGMTKFRGSDFNKLEYAAKVYGQRGLKTLTAKTARHLQNVISGRN